MTIETVQVSQSSLWNFSLSELLASNFGTTKIFTFQTGGYSGGHRVIAQVNHFFSFFNLPLSVTSNLLPKLSQRVAANLKASQMICLCAGVTLLLCRDITLSHSAPCSSAIRFTSRCIPWNKVNVLA